MNKCVVCGEDSGKGKTCSNTCRSKLARSVAKGVANATVEPKRATVDATVGPKCDNGVTHPINILDTDVEVSVTVTGKPGDADYNGVCLDAKYDSKRIA